MPNKYLFLFLFAIFYSLQVEAQLNITGKVIDSETKQSVQNAEVTFIGSALVYLTDENGEFSIQTDSNQIFLEVTADGYEFWELEISNSISGLKIELVKGKSDSEIYQLDEVVIQNKNKKYRRKKDNPAYGIMEQLWARKKQNGLLSVPQYEYEEYEKLEFDLNNLDSAFIKSRIFKDMDFIFENIDTSEITGKSFLPTFLNESIYKVYGRNQPSKKERRDLIANKNSGFDDSETIIEMMKNLFRDYNIYDNRLNFFNINFVSPIARDGFAVYDYELVDTLQIDDVDVYHIKYHPLRTGEYTFRGEFFVSSKTYAVKEITMQTTKSLGVNFVRDLFVYHEFDVKNDTIFYPKKDYVMIDMSLLSKKDESKGMFAHRTVTYKDYDFENPHPEEFYSDRIYDPYLEGAFERDDEYWKTARHEKLSKNEDGIYTMLDKLKEVPRFNRMVKLVDMFSSAYYDTGLGFSIGNIFSTFGNNTIEGFRLRLGARTFFSRNDMWRVGGYLAYGFKDNQFKYGIEARMMFNKFNRFQVGIGTKRDIEQLGSQLTLSNGILERGIGSSAVFIHGEIKSLSRINQTSAYVSIDPWKNFTVRMDGNFLTARSADRELFNMDYLHNGTVREDLSQTDVSLSLIAQPGAKFSQYGIDRIVHRSLAAHIMLRYTKGISGIFGSQFNYDKIQFRYAQPILIGSFGRSEVVLEAGKTFGGVPISLLSVIPANQGYGSIQGAFTQLNYYDFVTDSYSTLMWEHHFKGWILNKIPLIKHLKLREVGFIRGAWGGISHESIDINRSEVQYLAPSDHIYYEYGFGIENIGIGNVRPLRIDFNWRGNYLNMSGARNFGVTFSMGIVF